MNGPTSAAMHSVVIGAGATAMLDLWAMYVARAFGARGLDYGLLGRWVGHLAVSRKFRHEAIAAAAPLKAEQVLGWVAHYAVGVVFAGVLVATGPAGWPEEPTPAPALAVGLLAIACPFLILQPGMGQGFAASKSPDPTAARLRSLGSHTVFGLGLYLAALLLAQLRL